LPAQQSRTPRWGSQAEARPYQARYEGLGQVCQALWVDQPAGGLGRIGGRWRREEGLSERLFVWGSTLQGGEHQLKFLGIAWWQASGVP
jgi:hypothetical protein